MAMQYPDIKVTKTPGVLLSDQILSERYNWISSFISLNGVPPTIREMARGWGLSTTTVHGTLDRLEELEWVSFTRRESGNRSPGSMVLKRPPVVADLSHLSMPKVSIVICTYKRPESLRALLEAVDSQYHTDFRDIEAIIVNDGSHDDSYKWLTESSFRFRCEYSVRERHPEGKPSLYACKNIGIERASHELIWLLDDDLTFDRHTLFSLREKHMFLRESRPLIIPHYANPQDPGHMQAPFDFMPQPVDWDKTRAWPSFAGMSFWKKDWESVGGIDERYDGAMGFADLDFGIMMFHAGCQIILADGITCFIDDRESGGSHRDRFLFNHANARKFTRKWPDEWEKYDPGLADVAP